MAALPRLAPLAAALLLAGCGGGAADDANLDVEGAYGTDSYVRDARLNVENVSSHGAADSHNRGQNCVRCHQEHGPGAGLFTVAGTIAGPDGEWLEDPVVQLLDAPLSAGGQPVVTLEGDRLGNFFTTAPLDLAAQPLFPVVRSQDGTLEAAMPFPISSGSCNHCHAGGFRVTLREPVAGAAGAPGSDEPGSDATAH